MFLIQNMETSTAPTLDTLLMVSFTYIANISKLMFFNMMYLQDGIYKVLQFLRHLLPLVHPPSGTPTTGKVISKIISDLDYLVTCPSANMHLL